MSCCTLAVVYSRATMLLYAAVGADSLTSPMLQDGDARAAGHSMPPHPRRPAAASKVMLVVKCTTPATSNNARIRLLATLCRHIHSHPLTLAFLPAPAAPLLTGAAPGRRPACPLAAASAAPCGAAGSRPAQHLPALVTTAVASVPQPSGYMCVLDTCVLMGQGLCTARGACVHAGRSAASL